MKKLLATLLVVLFAQSAVRSQPQMVPGVAAGAQPPIWLIRNSWETAESLPANFRKLPEGLPASGSGEFSLIGLNMLKERIGRYKLTVIDLRDESHGFLNGLPVSWYQGEDQINWGKSLAEIETDENHRLGILLQTGNAAVYELAKPKTASGYKFGENPQLMRVRSASTEEQLCRSASVGYVRIPVADYHAPSAASVDQYVALVNTLTDADWLHVHCAAGDGRTTTFLAMFQIMHDGGGRSLEEIVKRQQQLGGINLFNTRTSSTWKDQYAAQRAQFIRDFYGYCRDERKNGYKTPFSQWADLHRANGPA